MRSLPNSLRIRITLLVALVFIPVFILTAVSAHEQEQNALDQAKTDALALAQVLGADNSQYIESTQRLLATVSRLDAVRQKDWEACTTIFTDLFENLALYVNVFAVDTATGLNMCSVSARSVSHDNSSYAWYQEVVRTRSPVVSEYRIGPVSGKPIITIAVPAYTEAGELVAVVAAGISLDWLNTSLSHANLPDNGRVTLVDRNGIILARYQEDTSVGKPYPVRDVLHLVQSRKQGTVEANADDGESRLYGYTSLGSERGNIGIIVSFPASGVLAEATASRNRSLIILVGITFMVIVVGWVSSGMIVRPIQTLTGASRALAHGQLTSRASLGSDIVELQHLLDAFNEMAASVEKDAQVRLEQLAEANRNLEHEIEERKLAQAHTKILQELTASLSEAVTIEDMLRLIVEKGLSSLGGHRASIIFSYENKQPLKLLYITSQCPEQSLQYGELDVEDRLPLVDAFRTSKAVWIKTEQEYAARYPQLYQLISQEPVRTQSAVCLPLTVSGRTLGSIGVAFPDERVMDEQFEALMNAIGHYCAQALERACLALQAQETAVIEERQRLARDLHDAISQTLFSSTIIVESIMRHQHPEKAAQFLEKVLVLNRGAMAEMRTLLYALRPEALEKAELNDLIGYLIEAAKGRTHISAELTTQGANPSLPPDVRIGFYRIAQEGINNIIKHSKATRCRVELVYGEAQLMMSISDNGRGFDSAQPTAGFGLQSMQERSDHIGAVFELVSEPEKGTYITVSWRGTPVSLESEIDTALFI